MAENKISFAFELRSARWVYRGVNRSAVLTRVPAGWQAEIQVYDHRREGRFEQLADAKAEATRLLTILSAH